MSNPEKLIAIVSEFPTGEVNSEVSVTSVTATTASFIGKVTGLSGTDFSAVKVGLIYSTDRDALSQGSGTELIATDIAPDGSFTLSCSDLILMNRYYYCPLVIEDIYRDFGKVSDFTTLSQIRELDFLSAKEYTSSANCYIVSEQGLYKFRTVQGNSSESVGTVASAAVLWESFGTDVAPAIASLISGVCYKSGYIAFEISSPFREGNALIAARDASGNILWSWHIWLTDQPKGQTYNNGAGVMMDRNPGATSATPGDVGALGLLYQWGRKDPFLNSSSISSSTEAESTITWPSEVFSSLSTGTIAFATSHPTTFITGNNYDWYYTSNSSTDNTRWQSSKTIYDPCPSGWRVPDGGSSDVWSKAFGERSYWEALYWITSSNWDSSNKGMDFLRTDKKLGSSGPIWYPASGYRYGSSGSLRDVGSIGRYWSVSTHDNYTYGLYFFDYGCVYPSGSSYYRANGQSVRCLQE